MQSGSSAKCLLQIHQYSLLLPGARSICRLALFIGMRPQLFHLYVSRGISVKEKAVQRSGMLSSRFAVCGQFGMGRVAPICITSLNSMVESPIEELIGFERIPLSSGEAKMVTLPSGRRVFARLRRSVEAVAAGTGSGRIRYGRLFGRHSPENLC